MSAVNHPNIVHTIKARKKRVFGLKPCAARLGSGNTETHQRQGVWGRHAGCHSLPNLQRRRHQQTVCVLCVFDVCLYFRSSRTRATRWTRRCAPLSASCSRRRCALPAHAREALAPCRSRVWGLCRTKMRAVLRCRGTGHAGRPWLGRRRAAHRREAAHTQPVVHRPRSNIRRPLSGTSSW